MNKESFYFPHFTGARHDRKVKRMMKDLGNEGYAIFFMLLEVLREQPDLSYPLSDVELLEDEFMTSKSKIMVVIKNYNLFTITHENFFSPKQIQYLEPYFKNKDQRRKAAIARWDKEKNKIELQSVDNQLPLDATALRPHCDSSTTEMQIQIQTTKETQKKEEIDIDLRLSQFEKFWEFYNKKVDRKQCEQKFLKLNESELGLIRGTIQNYIESTSGENEKYRKNPLTYLNGKCWLDEKYHTKPKSKNYNPENP